VTHNAYINNPSSKLKDIINENKKKEKKRLKNVTVQFLPSSIREKETQPVPFTKNHFCLKSNLVPFTKNKKKYMGDILRRR